MSCQHAACAACAGPVSEGRCPTCRAVRASMHSGTTPAALQALVVLLAALAIVLLTLSGLPAGR